MYETLIVNGTDLATVVTCMQSLDGLYDIGEPRGSNVEFPGVDGVTYTDKAISAASIDFGVILAGVTTPQFNDSFRALKNLIQPGELLQLERRLSYSTGNESHYATGEYAGGLSPSVAMMRVGRVTLSLTIHTGLWYAGSPTTAVVPSGSQAVAVTGEARTHKMTVTMAPGASITNTTTGNTLTNVASAGGNVVIDVLEMTATQDGNDVSGSIAWTGRYPMRLKPGTNNFTGSGATISYYPAYR